MALPQLEQSRLRFYVVGDRERPTELFATYNDPLVGEHASRTYWHPTERSLGGNWRGLTDRREAHSVASAIYGPASADDDLESIEHRLRLSVAEARALLSRPVDTT